jgi:hypothetical protein
VTSPLRDRQARRGPPASRSRDRRAGRAASKATSRSPTPPARPSPACSLRRRCSSAPGPHSRTIPSRHPDEPHRLRQCQGLKRRLSSRMPPPV